MEKVQKEGRMKRKNIKIIAGIVLLLAFAGIGAYVIISTSKQVVNIDLSGYDKMTIMCGGNGKEITPDEEQRTQKSSPNLCVNSSFSYVVLSTLLLSSRDLTEWSLVYHSTLSYQRFYDLHSIHYDHLEGLHQLI